MKQIPLFISILISGLCYSQSNIDSSFFQINFSASSTIKVKYKNFTDTITCTSNFYNFLPNKNIVSEPIKLYGEGTTFIHLKTQRPQVVNLNFLSFYKEAAIKESGKSRPLKDLKATCFLVPFDTLEIEIDYKKLPNSAIAFTGKYAPISKYYWDKKTHFKDTDLRYQKGMISNMLIELSQIKRGIDSITKLETDFLNTYKSKNNLPQWFIDYEHYDLTYSAFGLKLSAPFIKEFNQGNLKKKGQYAPMSYYDFAANIPLNNEKAILSEYYFISLRDYYQHLEVKTFTSNDSTIKPSIIEPYIRYTHAHFNPYISDLLLAIEVELLISINRFSSLELDMVYNALKSTSFKNYVKERFANRVVLKKGDKAPSFMLKTETNDFFSSKKFVGKLIYLTFWSTSCKPCLYEFEFENKLIETFKNDSVTFINICLESTEEQWKKIINKFQLKALNLYANENWQEILKNRYDISPLPHFTLIDKNGYIIENKCVRPSNGAEHEIRKRLNQQP